MPTGPILDPDSPLHRVRRHVFAIAAATGHVPQAAQIAAALTIPLGEVERALEALAAGRVLVLAPNGGEIWTANPFCAVLSGFRVRSRDVVYQGICIWDALGIAAALDQDALIEAPCGDCGDSMQLEVCSGELTSAEGLVHFAVPAARWWDNIGFT
jgi:hypothetical protein